MVKCIILNNNKIIFYNNKKVIKVIKVNKVNKKYINYIDGLAEWLKHWNPPGL